MRTNLFFLLTIFFGIVCGVPQNGFAQESRPMVRLIYFLPNDRQPQPDIDAKMDRLIKDVQQFYADQMEAHGFERKTFQFETDALGKAIVHHIKGKFDDTHYHNRSGIVWEEISEQFDLSRNIYLTTLDIGSETLGGAVCGIGLGNSHSGRALMLASGYCFNFSTAAHELGHTFGLPHDFRSRSGAYIMAYGLNQNQISQCAAEWLDRHRAFNPSQADSDEPATIKMLSQSLASPPNAIHMRFEVTDPDELHHAHLITPEKYDGIVDTGGIIACKRLYGRRSIVEFLTTELTPKNETVYLTVIDVNGNFSRSQNFPIDITSILLPPKVVSIPDPNLAAAIRQEIGNAITTHTLLNLTSFSVYNSGITDLSGLQHAHNLRFLGLGGDYISGKGVVNSNMVSDFSPLLGLTQLTWLELGNGGISDISMLSNLTQLRKLHLYGNNISDISPLKKLTQLRLLDLNSSSISDISVLSNLTELTYLSLRSNAVSDISSLTGLTQLVHLDLGINDISDISALSGLTQLDHLDLRGNSISDVSVLSDLIQLTLLDLTINDISDISALSGLTQLTKLSLEQNDISDISALSSLTHLTALYLSSNNISDMSPLIGLNLTGTQWNSTGLFLINNPLNYTSVHTYIPAMQSKGIEVKFDNRTHAALVKITGNTQAGEVGTTLATPLVVEGIDPHGKPMTGLSVTFQVIEGGGRLSATTATTDANGNAQTTLTLGPNLGVNKVRVTSSRITSPVTFIATATEPSRFVMDVNGDGAVNILDLVTIVSSFNQTGPNSADVNGDGIVNLLDLVLVAGAFEDGAAAAPTLHPYYLEGLTAADMQHLLMQARRMALTDPTYLRGIGVLEQLLALLLPKETALLSNYPNPFNPETWIPYQLAAPSDVTLHIYSVDGKLVRTLALGHQPVGMYHSKNRAAYWDGRNEQDERVASGIYFYTFTVRDFTATQKMLIKK